MAISIKSRHEVELMRKAGEILAKCFQEVAANIAVGVTTAELNRIAEDFFQQHNGIPSFKGVPGMTKGAPVFPAAMCASVNEEVIHGIPGKRALLDGDIVSIDMGVIYKGYHSDMARTFCVGAVSEETKRLLSVTEESFFKGIEQAVPGNRIADISAAIQKHVEEAGFSVVRDYVGHGIGTDMHEPPQVPNYVEHGRGVRLQAGMTLAIEPMVNVGGYQVRVLPNYWTVVTRDHSLSAHYENTIVVCDGNPEILSAV